MARIVTRKISLSGATLKSVLASNGRQCLGRVAGIALGTKENVHPQYGISYGLVGTFRHIAQDGTESNAPVVWGPGVLIDPIRAALEGGAQSVQVLADVYAIESETSPVGFMYVLETHGDDAEDPITKLLQASNVTPLPSLLAPAVKPAPTVKPAKAVK